MTLSASSRALAMIRSIGSGAGICSPSPFTRARVGGAPTEFATPPPGHVADFLDGPQQHDLSAHQLVGQLIEVGQMALGVLGLLDLQLMPSVHGVFHFAPCYRHEGDLLTHRRTRSARGR